ncbi:hypothetical protein [Bacteroides sp. 51]|uniref:hypothetical protein n=1 Tax=Bacteroides sp. 51 TaxID=2302938 RepID=UPI0013D42840|nr:hypothetical protein [Bacteroides sp. 51]NDV81077.1 hypothetical protein [Bacteroides sp. 51]
MKRLVLLLFSLISIMAYGQKNEYSDVTFYGTDFSLVKVYGSDNSPYQFQEAFYGMNRLFLSEPKKYNVQKILGIKVNAVDLGPVEKQNDKIDTSGLLINGYGGYELTTQQVEQAIKNLPIESKEGTGLVLVAEVLNKASARGSFKVVFFDIASRQVLEMLDGKGKAQGFGLRNYWAHAMLDAVKKAQ